MTPADIVTAEPAIWPFANHDLYKSFARPLPKPLCPTHTSDKKQLDEYLSIAAVLVFHDSRDWGLDAQIISDVFRSNRGCIGSRIDSQRSDTGPTPFLMFSNPDPVWQSDYHKPRFGQGNFIKAVRRIIGGHRETLRYKFTGKPSLRQFQFAQERLEARHRTLLGNRDVIRGKGGEGLGRVYMVGDNLISDIVGANQHNIRSSIPWFPLLVRTGVYGSSSTFDEPSEFRSSSKPVRVVEDVSAAVDWALEDAHSSRSVDGSVFEDDRRYRATEDLRGMSDV